MRGRDRGMTSSQRTSRRLGCLALVAASLGAWASSAAADGKYDRVRRQHPDLFKVYYDETVMAYCGLLTFESEAGFKLERDALLVADPVSDETHRDLRVASDMAVDYAYQDHGLSGQKRWCKTEGLDAYNRFVDRYRSGTASPQ